MVVQKKKSLHFKPPEVGISGYMLPSPCTAFSQSLSVNLSPNLTICATFFLLHAGLVFFLQCI